MASEVSKAHLSVFETIKQTDEKGNESWSARDLAKVLKYSEYRHFLPVIERAREACTNSGQQLADHFEDILEMVDIGSRAKRKIDSVKLSRYACYLIVQNADVLYAGKTNSNFQNRFITHLTLKQASTYALHLEH